MLYMYFDEFFCQECAHFTPHLLGLEYSLCQNEIDSFKDIPISLRNRDRLKRALWLSLWWTFKLLYKYPMQGGKIRESFSRSVKLTFSLDIGFFRNIPSTRFLKSCRRWSPVDSTVELFSIFSTSLLIWASIQHFKNFFHFPQGTSALPLSNFNSLSATNLRLSWKGTENRITSLVCTTIVYYCERNGVNFCPTIKQLNQ